MTETHTDQSTDQVSAEAVRWTDGRWRSWLDVGVFLVVGSTFWLAAGLPGVGMTALLILAWVALPNVAVFVAGQIAVGALVSPDASLAAKALPSGALVGLLLTTTVTDRWLRDSLAVLVSLGLLAAVAGVTYVVTELVWPTVVVVLVASAAGFVSLDLIALSQLGGSIDE